MISDLISKNIPPRMKILNMVMPIQLHFCSFVSNLSVASNKMWHNKWRQYISQDILLQIFDVIQSDIALQNHVHWIFFTNHLTFVLLNIFMYYTTLIFLYVLTCTHVFNQRGKNCWSWSGGFVRSQLIWIYKTEDEAQGTWQTLMH